MSGGSLIPRPSPLTMKLLVGIEYILGLADSAVLMSGVPIRKLPCDIFHNNNHVTKPLMCHALLPMHKEQS